MTSPVKGNFGHIRESGVLLLTKEDSDEKHKRNAKLAGLSFASVFTLGFGVAYLAPEVEREQDIRNLGRRYPELPYSKCVELEKSSVIIYKGHQYSACPSLTPQERDRIDEQLLHSITRDQPKVKNSYPYQPTGSDLL